MALPLAAEGGDARLVYVISSALERQSAEQRLGEAACREVLAFEDGGQGGEDREGSGGGRVTTGGVRHKARLALALHSRERRLLEGARRRLEGRD